MVGEQAAMETPPEVLAMVMGQMGAQQAAPQGAGIGALPQAQEMAPPGMMPPDMGMQAPAPEMMPQGMEGSGPFPSGGAEQAPPQNFAVGGLVAGARLAAPYLTRAGQAVNQYMGRTFMAPQFTTQTMRGPGGQQLVGQARESLRMMPGGKIAQGTGTQFAPMTTLGPMQAPTFTQGIQQGLAPVMASTAGRTALGLGGGSLAATGMINAFAPDQQMSEADILAAGRAMNTDTSQIPGEEPAYVPPPVAEQANTIATGPEVTVTPDEVVPAVEAAPADDTNAFIGRVAEQAKQKTRADRIRESFSEISPLYKELLGDDDGTRKTQALLLLADAGFKFAGSTKPNMGTALAEALSGMPAGMSALAAQRAERESKVKSAALSQAVEDVAEEDKAARALQLEALKGDYRVLVEQAKNKGGTVLKDGGAGLRVAETSNGSFMGYSIDPSDPTVQRAVTSRYTLTPNNPFVTVGGQAPQTPETDKAARVTLTKKVRDLDEALGMLETAKSQLSGAYGPGAWYSSFENNMLVPITPLNPNVADEAKKTSINQTLNRLMTKIASADTEGRTSVFAQEQVNTILPAKAGEFFQDAEVNAGRFNALQALIMNQRQEALAQLGYVTQELTMNAPSTGTKNDPFTLPADEQGQANMLRFLGGTIGKVTDPNALVYIRTPDGTVRPFKASELRNTGGQ
jgi:hypothetical protein